MGLPREARGNAMNLAYTVRWKLIGQELMRRDAGNTSSIGSKRRPMPRKPHTIVVSARAEFTGLVR